MAKILTISHYIYLSKEERYQLFNQIPVETVGINVPVWFDKGTTSEPAKEIFCRYCITNNKTSKSIASTLEGYNINLPQNFTNYKLDVPSVVKLLDVKDGGCEDLTFKQNAKLNKDNKNYSVIHFIEIKPIEVLLETIVQ